MTLLAPWNAVAAVAIAAPLLLLLYFLKLRRKRLRVSSTMLWERAVDDLQVNEPFRWLRTSWLLVLQMLALACLALALGRPTIPGGGLLDDRVLVVIDASASMSATDSPTDESRLAEAKRRAIDLVEDLPGDAAVQVMVFASEPAVLTGMSTDHGAALRAIRSIEPTDQPGDLAEAVRLAGALTGSSGQEDMTEATRVVLVTDGGSIEGTDALAGEPLLLRVGPGVDAPVDNIGIVAAHARRDYTDPARLGVFLRLQSTLASETAVSLAIELDGAIVERTAVTVPGRVGDEPGSKALTVNLLPESARRLRVSVRRDDALGADNTVWSVLPEQAQTRALLVTPGDEIAWVVGDVLRALPRVELRQVGVGGLRELLSEPEALDAFDIAVLDRVGDPSSLPVPTLSFGVRVGDQLEVANDDAPGSDRFVTWERASPAMRDLALDGVSIASPSWFIGPDAERGVLARGRTGPLVVETSDRRPRRIAVSFAPAESTWPIEVSFPLFVAQAVESLSLQSEAARGSIRTGQSVSLPLGSNLDPVLTGPTTLTGRRTGEDAIGDRVTVSFPPPTRVGQYASSDGAAVVGVNLLDPAESSIRVSDRLTLGGSPLVAGSGEAGRREIWPWLVVIGAALLVLEWVVFVVRSRV